MLCNYPNPKQVLDNEKETLKFLQSQKDISSNFHRFHDDVCTELARLKSLNLKQKPKDLFKIDSYMDIKVDNQMRRVFIGGLIRLGTSQVVEQVTYSIAICENTCPSKVLRRFHFDFDLKTDSSRPSDKPFYHLQYGGEMSPRMISEGFRDSDYNHIDSWLSLPRIIHIPMSFIFVVFLVIKELDKEHSDILSKPGWNTQMRNSEKLMLENYHETCFRAIRNDKSVLMECYY